MQFKRGHFIAEWSSVASQYFERFGVCGTLKYLKTNYNSFFHIRTRTEKLWCMYRTSVASSY